MAPLSSRTSPLPILRGLSIQWLDRTQAMHRFSLTTFALLVYVSVALAGPGHDHSGNHDRPTTAAREIPRIESVGSDMELVATAEGHELTIYLDHSASNEPIDGAKIEVSGEGIAPAVATRLAPGTYGLEAEWLEVPGTKALVFTVSAGDMIDLLNGTLIVPNPQMAEAVRPSPLREVVMRPDILGLLGGAVVLGFVMALLSMPRRQSNSAETESKSGTAESANTSSVRNAAEVILIAAIAIAMLQTGDAQAGPGHDHGDHGHGAVPVAQGSNSPRKLPDGTVFVPKPTQRLLQVRTEPAKRQSAPQTRELIGTVVSDPSAFGQVQSPMDGKIEVTDRGISHVGQKVQAGDMLALLSPTIPVADLGTLQQVRAEVEGKLRITEQRLARLTRIASVVAQRQIDETRAELDALREQRRVLTPKDVEKLELVAPVSGIISLANVKAGQVVSARETLFEIVDPARLWVEGIGSDIHGDGDIVAAQGLDTEGHVLRLSYVGRAPTLRQQSRPYLFRIDDAHTDLSIGAPLKVVVQKSEMAQGFIVPDSAVVRGANGLPQVWIKVSPERFRPAMIRSLQLDGARTLVTDGIEEGERVLITGAELVNQIR